MQKKSSMAVLQINSCKNGNGFDLLFSRDGLFHTDEKKNYRQKRVVRFIVLYGVWKCEKNINFFLLDTKMPAAACFELKIMS